MRKTIIALLLIISSSLANAVLPVYDCNPNSASPCGFANSLYFFQNFAKMLSSVQTTADITTLLETVQSDRTNTYRTPDGRFGVMGINIDSGLIILHPDVMQVGKTVHSNTTDTIVRFGARFPNSNWLWYEDQVGKIGIFTETTIEDKKYIFGASMGDSLMTVQYGCSAKYIAPCSIYNVGATLGSTMAVMIEAETAEGLETTFKDINADHSDLFKVDDSFFSYVVETSTNTYKVHMTPAKVNTVLDSETATLLKTAAQKNDHEWVLYKDPKDGKEKMSLNFILSLYGKEYLIGSSFVSDSLPNTPPCSSLQYSECSKLNAKRSLANIYLDMLKSKTEDDLKSLLASVSDDTTGRYIRRDFYPFVIDAETRLRVAHRTKVLVGKRTPVSTEEAVTRASQAPYASGVAVYTHQQRTKLAYVTTLTKFGKTYYIGSGHGVGRTSDSSAETTNQKLFVSIALEAFALVVSWVISLTFGVVLCIERWKQRSSREQSRKSFLNNLE